MTKVPSLSFVRILSAMGRLGFEFVSQKGSHIKMRRILPDGRLQFFLIPAHKPVKRSTLARALGRAGVRLEEFLEML